MKEEIFCRWEESSLRDRSSARASPQNDERRQSECLSVSMNDGRVFFFFWYKGDGKDIELSLFNPPKI